MSSPRSWLADAAALVAVLLATLSPSVWARLYFQTNTTAFLVVLAAALLGAVALLMGLVARVQSRVDPGVLLRGGVVGSVVLCLGVIATGGSVGRSPMPILIATAVAVGAACSWQFARSPMAWWPRVRTAVTIGGVLFFGSAPLLGHLASRNTNFLAPVADASRIPTVWLLLDETSFGAADALVTPLLRQGLWTSIHPLEPAGRNTLDVVPSIVSRVVMGLATTPCGLTTVCAESSALDFSRVAVGRAGVDVIGIQHPYCAMQGWRTCMDSRRSPAWSDQWQAMRCKVARTAAPPLIDACEKQRAVLAIAMREEFMAAVLAAPFWSEGGDLFAHLLLPHLPASAHPMPSLAAAYEQNVSAAADFVGVLGLRLQQRFPQGFVLVVFSDHPLRPVSDCSAAYDGHCERPARYAHPYKIPLIVAAPRPVNFVAPPSNLGVFDLAPLSLEPKHRPATR